MTEDELKAQERAQKREFPETMALLKRIRTAMAERLFKTAVSAKDEREDLFIKVQAIDALTSEMERVLGNGSEAIEAYVEQFQGEGQ